MALRDYKTVPLRPEVLDELEACLECRRPGTLQVDERYLHRLRWCCECMTRFVSADSLTDKEYENYIREVENGDLEEGLTAGGQETPSSLPLGKGESISPAAVNMMRMTIKACPTCRNSNVDDMTIMSEDTVKCGQCDEVWKLEISSFQEAPVLIDCTKCQKEQQALSFYKIGKKLNAICMCGNEYIVEDEDKSGETVEGDHQCDKCSSVGPFFSFDSENGFYTVLVCCSCHHQMVIDDKFEEPLDDQVEMPKQKSRDKVREQAVGLPKKKRGIRRMRSAILRGGGILKDGVLGIEEPQTDTQQIQKKKFEGKVVQRITSALKLAGTIGIVFIPEPCAQMAAEAALPLVAGMIGKPLGKIVAKLIARAK